MAFFSKFFTAVYLSIMLSSSASAYTYLTSTPNPGAIGRRAMPVGAEAFYPETKFETFVEGLEQPSSFAISSLSDAAISFATSHLGVDNNQVMYGSGYTSDSVSYAYIKQAHEGIPFANAVANIAWKNNKVVSFGPNFVTTDNIASSNPSLTVQSVIPNAEKVLGGKYNGHPTSLEYLARPDGSVTLIHVLQIRNEEAGTWYEAFVDAHSGQVVPGTDYITEAVYNVLPITEQAFPDGPELLIDPQDTLSSPFGWHSTDGVTQSNATSGNNVISFKGDLAGVTNQSAPGLAFNYTYNAADQPPVGQNVDAARTNAFYIANMVHDFTYRYGFTEVAFNFQNDNFQHGGQENDGILMSVQDASGVNNAFFYTPPDGQQGLCEMFIWNLTVINRDGAMENDILVHELAHGVTNRMTGGGTARCLQTLESTGLGEGWSDAMAEWTEQTSATVEDFTTGSYVVNRPNGIRQYPYSTNPKINPLKYSDAGSATDPHPIGEVWANMLHNVYAPLVAAYGFSTTAQTTPDGTEGNVVYLHLFIDGLALQPCNPTFVSARDAIIQADQNRYNGVNQCLLWTAFASRGLGVNATNFQDDTSVPSDC